MKKQLTLFFSLFVLLTTVAAEDWNFSSNSFNSLGTISTTTSVDGLTIYADATRTVAIDANSQIEGGIQYAYCLQLSGSGGFNTEGTPAYRVLSFPVSGPVQITVKSMSSSSSEDRQLTIKMATGEVVGSAPASAASLTAYTCSYIGGPNIAYIYSTNSSVAIYQIKVTVHPDLIVNETFPNLHTTALPTGWATGSYYKGIATTGTSATASAVVDTVAGCLKISGSGSGDRGIGLTFPGSSNPKMVVLDYKWFSGNPGTQANKLVDLNFTDANGNSILYFYAENWTGSSNHFHCLNLNKSVIPSGAYYDNPEAAINANLSTLFGRSRTAYNFSVNTNPYHIQARIDFVTKRIVELKITSGTQSATECDLPFISEVSTSLKKMSCATYRNANLNNDGKGTSGNGSNAYLDYQIDNFYVVNIDSAQREAYYRGLYLPDLEKVISLADQITVGCTPETGLLGYMEGAKATFETAIASAKAVRDNSSSTADEVKNATASLSAAITTFDQAKLPVNEEVFLTVGNQYLMSTDTAAVWVSDKLIATMWEMTTNSNGYVLFKNGTKFLGKDGKSVAESSSYRLIADTTSCKLQLPASPSEFVTIAGIQSFTPTLANQLITFINESFNAKSINLPAGWGNTKYSKYLSNNMANANNVNATVDTIAGNLVICANGSGDRGSAFSFPSSGSEKLIDFQFDFYTGNPGTEANKMQELNLTDNLGNSVLYFYIENWTGDTSHIHCLNLNPAVNPGGARRYEYAAAIAANKTTLFPGKKFVPNSYWFQVKARLDFENKRVVSLMLIGNGDTAIAVDLPFISSSAQNISRFNCMAYRNSAVNSDGSSHDTGNGGNANLSLKFDNVIGTFVKAKEKEAYYKSINHKKLYDQLVWCKTVAAGNISETGALGYQNGAKSIFQANISQAESILTNSISTSEQLLQAVQSLNSAIVQFDAAKLPIAADYLLNNGGKFLMATDTTATYADTTILGNKPAQKLATLWTVTTDSYGHALFKSGNQIPAKKREIG
jgi:hypothetical protein